MYVKSIEILKDYRNLKEGLKIEFKDLNLLVGEQGCGKSTLLELLRDNDHKMIKIELSDDTIKNGVKTFYFDTEKMNPRKTNIDEYSNPDGTSKGIGIGAALASHFMSHGEVMREFTINTIKDIKNCVLFLDEPESALSLGNQYKLGRELSILYQRGVQCFAATHCLPVIELFSYVYSLEHLEWMDSDKFIISCKNGSKK